METVSILPRPNGRVDDPRIELLLADGDARLRSVFAARARDAVPALTVREAADGPQAIQLGLQRAPKIALLDAELPRLGGSAVAVTLRELRPQLRLALYSADPRAHRGRAREQGLPLFDKLDFDSVVEWLEAQANECVAPSRLPVHEQWRPFTGGAALRVGARYAAS